MDTYEQKGLIDDEGSGKVFKVVKKGETTVYAMKVIKLSRDNDKHLIKNEITFLKEISTIKSLQTYAIQLYIHRSLNSALIKYRHLSLLPCIEHFTCDVIILNI